MLRFGAHSQVDHSLQWVRFPITDPAIFRLEIPLEIGPLIQPGSMLTLLSFYLAALWCTGTSGSLATSGSICYQMADQNPAGDPV